MSLHLLTGEIPQAESRLQRPLNTEQVETQGTGLENRNVSERVPPSLSPPAIYPLIVLSLPGPVVVVQTGQAVQAGAGPDTGAEDDLRCQ